MLIYYNITFSLLQSFEPCMIQLRQEVLQLRPTLFLCVEFLDLLTQFLFSESLRQFLLLRKIYFVEFWQLVIHRLMTHWLMQHWLLCKKMKVGLAILCITIEFTNVYLKFWNTHYVVTIILRTCWKPQYLISSS